MNQGNITVNHPVKDIAKARICLRELLGIAPYADRPYSVGPKFGDQDIGPAPHGRREGISSGFHVDDIAKRLESLLKSALSMCRRSRTLAVAG